MSSYLFPLFSFFEQNESPVNGIPYTVYANIHQNWAFDVSEDPYLEGATVLQCINCGTNQPHKRVCVQGGSDSDITNANVRTQQLP